MNCMAGVSEGLSKVMTHGPWVAVKKGVKEELEPWDITFWSEQLKEEKYELKPDDLRYGDIGGGGGVA